MATDPREFMRQRMRKELYANLNATSTSFSNAVVLSHLTVAKPALDQRVVRIQCV